MLIEMVVTSKYNMVHNLLSMYTKHLELSSLGVNEFLLNIIASVSLGCMSINNE
jgi:hypothetical protein